MKKTKEVKYAAFAGVDWGDKEQAICLLEAGSERIERWTVRHTPQELRNWLDLGQTPRESLSASAAGARHARFAAARRR